MTGVARQGGGIPRCGRWPSPQAVVAGAHPWRRRHQCSARGKPEACVVCSKARWVGCPRWEGCQLTGSKGVEDRGPASQEAAQRPATTEALVAHTTSQPLAADISTVQIPVSPSCSVCETFSCCCSRVPAARLLVAIMRLAPIRQQHVPNAPFSCSGPIQFDTTIDHGNVKACRAGPRPESLPLSPSLSQMYCSHLLSCYPIING